MRRLLDTADQVGNLLRSFQYLRPVYALNSNSFTTKYSMNSFKQENKFVTAIRNEIR